MAAKSVAQSGSSVDGVACMTTDSLCPWPQIPWLSGTVVSHGTTGMYCYRVNRRLFAVPVDPGTPCRLCGTPRDQKGPETLEKPAQVR